MCDKTTEASLETQRVSPKATVEPSQYERKRVPGMCIKCKVIKPNVTIRRSLYCKACFVRTCVVKFRTALSRSRKNTTVPRTKLMVALSGGPSSSAMLNLMADFQRMELRGTEAQSRYEDIIAGHVDESVLFPDVQDSLISEIAISLSIECRITKLEDVFATNDEAPLFIKLVQSTLAPGALKDKICAHLVKTNDSISSKKRLQSLFSSLASATDREEMLDIIKTLLLIRLARKAECGVLLMGDSGTRIATKIVSLASRGRGFSLPFEVGAESSWFDNVVVYRPMRDFIMKEIAFFNMWTKQNSVVVPTFTTGAPKRASIGRLTESFVIGLDHDFSSTVSTICRTMQKLEPRKQALNSLPCLTCGMPVENDAQAWRSRLTVSKPLAVEAEPTIQSNGSNDVPSDEDGLVRADITDVVCYSCQNILTSAASGTTFPGATVDHFLKSKGPGDAKVDIVNAKQEALRKQIETFLLNDNE
ncbi:Cytoplasmic tRNA 2-thiolation protein 2 [Coemansia spiralis]|uniref:Cytoplasmic tRNA 2-thiolation protein 2 n=2 Tax=Coemansia TaxID=4863 RepID=A0A9W8G713_9FUNG|nr:Cytoplasmic tRNA 2-thiolation protein 2 [Coemansia umbellata]KAJ2620885.1 Cytoplasmic tRNA 2-thiolation protein 2 [Coemansia sp. RSA 1358]KAJ2675459.1 Cytoplasmic tRNA 2-thiolation protein 2 [Coemansia spiralis]